MASVPENMHKDLVEALSTIFNPRIIRLLKVMALNPEQKFFLKELTDKSSLPVATVHRLLNKMLRAKLLKETKIGHTRLYQFSDTPKSVSVAMFFKEEAEPLEIFVTEVSSLAGIVKVAVQGEPSRTRANLIMIGDLSGQEQADTVKRIVADIRENHKFTITPLVVTPEQFNQMTVLGYMGEVKIIWERKEQLPKEQKEQPPNI